MPANSNFHLHISYRGWVDNIENAVLYQELHRLDKPTLQALLMRTQGFSVTEISVELSLNKEVIYKRLNRSKKKINNDETTSNFCHNENFVVLEYVYTLLKQGYKPECIELEPKWEAPHEIGGGGKADVLVKDNDGNSFLLIECKTWGIEFDKYWKKQNLMENSCFFIPYRKEQLSFCVCMRLP